MTKRIISIALTALLLLLTLFAFAACTPTPTPDPTPDSKIPADLDLSGITLSGAEYFYDGGEHSLAVSGTLPAKVSVVYEGNSRVEVGSYTVTAKFYYEDEYVTGKDLTATLKIKALSELDLSGVSLGGKTVVYNGKAHSLEIEGTLPEGVTVAYEGNGAVDASDTPYGVTAKFYYKGVYVEGADLTASLRIDRASLADAMYGVAFNSTTVIYDGQAHSIYLVGNIPDAVTVTYLGNGVTGVGTHTVTASFEVDDNYLPIDDMTATITIKVIEEPAPELPDLSGIKLAGKTVTYDGGEHTLAIEGTLPEGVEVLYVGGGKVNAGEYSVVAKFYYNGAYVAGADLTATLTISKITVSLEGIDFVGTTVLYNGQAHSLAVSGILPEGVTVTYEGNGVSALGTHTVTAKFSVVNGNYVIEGATEKSATIVIEEIPVVAPVIPDLSGIKLTGKTVTYNGGEHTLEIEGTLPEGVEVLYVGNGKVNAGEYSVVAKFYYNGAYVAGADLTATLTVSKITVSLEGITFNGATVLFDAMPHSIAIEGTLPEGVTVSYVGGGVSEVGKYTVTAKFSTVNDNYVIEGATEKSAELEIMLLSTESLGLEFSDGEFVYDGKEHSLSVGNLPPSVTLLEYVGNGKVDAGTYTVTAKFAINGVYNSDLDMQATLTIKKAIIPVTVLGTEYTFAFDGTLKTPEAVSFDGMAGVTMKVSGAGKRFPGTYKVVYSFIIDPSMANNIAAREDIEVTMTITESTATTSGIIFTENSDGTYHVSGYEGSATSVIIPSTYNGKAVTAIASRAFENNKDIKYVKVPDSVVAIGQSAFRGCTSIEAITLPFVGGSEGSSKKYLGYVFGASEYVGNELYVPESLKAVELSDACTLIPAYSFYGCANITEVKIGSGVTEIGTSAFRGCTALLGIYIPKNVTLIQSAAHNYNSPFYDLPDSFVIYLEASSVPAEFASKWCVLDAEGNTAKVELGKSYGDFQSEVGN